MVESERINVLEERLRKIPQGVKTYDLISHIVTGEPKKKLFEKLESILTHGILSLYQQYLTLKKTYEGYSPDCQKAMAAYNFISVWDPWNGSHTRKEDVVEIPKKVKLFENKLYNLIGDKIKIAPYSGGYRYIEFEDYLKLPNSTKNKIDSLILSIFRRDKKINGNKPRLYYYFSGDQIEGDIDLNIQGTCYSCTPSVRLLIKTDKERVWVPSLYFPESYVKEKILPEEIVGIVMADPKHFEYSKKYAEDVKYLANKLVPYNNP